VHTFPILDTCTEHGYVFIYKLAISGSSAPLTYSSCGGLVAFDHLGVFGPQVTHSQKWPTCRSDPLTKKLNEETSKHRFLFHAAIYPAFPPSRSDWPGAGRRHVTASYCSAAAAPPGGDTELLNEFGWRLVCRRQLFVWDSLKWSEKCALPFHTLRIGIPEKCGNFGIGQLFRIPL
jgi:hypothetical protein